MGREEKRPLNRPSKRKLVRWNENLDELLLLTIQSVCNQEGVKIPWAEVAKSMSNDVTEGAIVQHLAKIRARRVQKDKEVPPPLRRGVGFATSPRSQETPATPVSPSQSTEESGGRRAKPQNEPKIKAEKRGASDDEYHSSSDSDKEWTSGRRNQSTKRSKQKRPQKKRKSTPPNPVLENGVDDNINHDDDNDDDGSMASNPDTEMVAVGAGFLEFANGERNEEYRATSISSDDEQSDTDKAMVVKLKVGAKKLRLLKHKGTGVFHDRDPEQRWELPPSGPNGEKWGFSRDYYGPVPKSCHNPQNPGLLRGEWPLDVAMRQYAAPQAVTWANETYEPDPRLVHPANYLEKPDCDPQLRFHRKLRTIEESNPDARVIDQDRPAYQAYVNTHRELPTYFDPSWNVAPTTNTTNPVGNYEVQGYSTTIGANLPITAAPSQATAYHDHDFSNFHLAHPQIEDEVDTHQVLDVKHTGTIDDHVDRDTELPPGKTFDVDEMLDQNIIGKAEENTHDAIAELAYEYHHEAEVSAFDTEFESFANLGHGADDIFSFI
ncbi:hypothetical protein UA08_08867 [Talaromyces atroroseus]|uniref:Myb-like domain-containing protein n=1 Tax=Talaromyces atroroseus TaxID=1441469 RepID=A0A225AN59_TALAT|nr:hypothetical protein UA08_08867 [Talaromyces atroroseus]OKL55865.1 hypothetical protein UA08_08867 [Talaromyces atroroseus]